MTGRRKSNRCILLAALFLGAGTVQAAPILDQVYDPSPPSLGSILTVDKLDAVQTFTVGVGGTLTNVEFLVSRNAGTVSDLLFDVRATTAGGAPIEDDLTTLASVTIPGASISTSLPAGFINVDISSFGVIVSPGDVLAFALRPTAGEGFNWGKGGGNPYPGGASYWRFASAGITTWTFDVSADMGFKTYVDPVPEPASLALMLVAGAVMLGRVRGGELRR